MSDWSDPFCLYTKNPGNANSRLRDECDASLALDDRLFHVAKFFVFQPQSEDVARFDVHANNIALVVGPPNGAADQT